MSAESAHIDLISNHSVFRDDQSFLALTRHGGAIPAGMYSSFIHEATHHWCFTSPVGSSLSLLYLSVARRVLNWAATGDESEYAEILDDLLTYRFVLEWLRPLSEGLALFAEFDVIPDPAARSMSPPFDAALLHLFQLPQRLRDAGESASDAVRYGLFDDINRWRFSAESVARKAELLLQPLNGPSGHYLMGYLAVKQLWRNAARRFPELADADLFMLFLRKMVYADYSLVARILDRSQPGASRALGAAEHLFERLWDGPAAGDAVVDWDAFHSSLRRTKWDPVPGATDRADGLPYVGRDNEDAVRQGVRLRRALNEEVLMPLEEHPDLDIFPRDFFANVLSERPFMWLCSTQGRWIPVAKNVGTVEVGDDVVFRDFKLRHASDEGLDRLRLDLYLDLYERNAFTTLGSDRGVFGVASEYDLDPEFVDEVLRTGLDREEILVVTRAFRETLHHYTKPTNFDEILEGLWSGGGRELLDKTYSSLAFDGDPAAHQHFARTGVAALMNNDAGLVRGLAAATLGASADMSPEAVAEHCDFDVPAAVQRAAATWPFPRLPLASVDGDGFLESAF